MQENKSSLGALLWVRLQRNTLEYPGTALLYLAAFAGSILLLTNGFFMPVILLSLASIIALIQDDFKLDCVNQVKETGFFIMMASVIITGFLYLGSDAAGEFVGSPETTTLPVALFKMLCFFIASFLPGLFIVSVIAMLSSNGHSVDSWRQTALKNLRTKENDIEKGSQDSD